LSSSYFFFVFFVPFVVKFFMPLVLEGLVSTLDAAGGPHLAPMGPHLPAAEFDRFTLRPFPTSQTFRNLKAHGEGVLHMTDDVLLLAKAAIGPVEPPPDYDPAAAVRGWVLRDCCRFFEFRLTAVDESEQRVRIEAMVVHAGRKRNFFGFNRAKHAVLEAAVLATRTAFLPFDEIAADYRRLAVIVEKTGGSAEHQAMRLLQAHLDRASRAASAPGGSRK
jgi:hypothetical protein